MHIAHFIVIFQRTSENEPITNEFVDNMVSAISAFADRQVYLNGKMSVPDLSAVRGQARMGFNRLQESLETTNGYIRAKTGNEGANPSEYEAFRESVLVDDVSFHPRQKSLLNLSKTDYCSFCEDFQTRMDRHLERNHKYERQVSEFLEFKSSNPPRFRSMRRKLIGEMNRTFNSSLERDQAILSVDRKKLKMATRPCPYCCHEYAQRRLSRHMNKCPSKSLFPLEKQVEKGERNRFKSASRFELLRDVADDDARETLSKMSDDAVTELVRTDEVLLRYLVYQCRRYTHLKFFRTIVQKVRNMGSFLLHAIQSEKFDTFSEILDPLRFKEVYDLILSFAGAGAEEDFNLKYPSKTKSTSEPFQNIPKYF